MTEIVVECSPLVLRHLGWAPLDHVTASDVSGEAGSEQGWSVLGPPGKSASGIPNLAT